MVTVVGQQKPVHNAPTGDEHWMRLALVHARQAASQGEVPVGAIVVDPSGQLLASGHNSPIGTHDPTGHAELVALRAAANVLGNYRLTGCTLYVTLEPCAMCSGAMLHARLARVVFGAPDAKTGAAGSVLNLFALPSLNHQTQLQGGVLAEACAHELKTFFATRRHNPNPLREDALRTPTQRFAQLPPLPGTSQWVSQLPALGGLRLHFLDEAPLAHAGAVQAVVCLHSADGWGWQYRHVLPALVAQGVRVVVPDLIGFGHSDKPKKEHTHTLAWHAQVLVELLHHLGVQQVLLLLPADGGMNALGRHFQAAWQHARPQGWVGTALCSTPEPEPEPSNAPFPDNGFRAALRAFACFEPSAPPSNAVFLAGDLSAQAGGEWVVSHVVQALNALGTHA